MKIIKRIIEVFLLIWCVWSSAIWCLPVADGLASKMGKQQQWR